MLLAAGISFSFDLDVYVLVEFVMEGEASEAGEFHVDLEIINRPDPLEPEDPATNPEFTISTMVAPLGQTSMPTL